MRAPMHIPLTIVVLKSHSGAKELQSISDDPYARIVSSFVGEERFHIIVSVASKNLKQQRLSLLQKRLYGNQA